MCTKSDSHCGCADSIHRERVRYFQRQLLTADDMTVEQLYLRQKLRRHNRLLHGWGVVCGCSVKPLPDKDHPWRVVVCPGYVITPCGDEVVITEQMEFDLAGDLVKAQDPCENPSPCPPIGVRSSTDKPDTIHLAVCYKECDTRPVRVHPAGCACDEVACEYSRIRDSFELVKLLDLPKSHSVANDADRRWDELVKEWLQQKSEKNVSSRRNTYVMTPGSTSKKTLLQMPVPECPKTPEDNCAVLASIKLPTKRSEEIDFKKINYENRRVLLSESALYQIIAAMR